jgi:broad specificity phosphatase PhoE
MGMIKNDRNDLTTFGLLRHGQTEWNRLKKIQGSNNSPLTSKGQEMTAEWCLTLKKYNWDRIFASDMGRVKETVSILNRKLNVPVEYDKQLREQFWGDWEGLTLPYVKETFREELEQRVKQGWHFSAPGGETRQAVRDRTISALSEAGRKWPGQNILIVCHQGVIKSILYSIAERKFLPGDEKMLKPNSFHLIGHRQNQFSITELNIDRRK